MNANEKMVGVDVPRVTPDQARELMFHHLGIACAYFDATPSNADDNLDELHRVFGTDDTDIRHRAVYAFVDHMTRGHADLEVAFAEKDRVLTQNVPVDEPRTYRDVRSTGSRLPEQRKVGTLDAERSLTDPERAKLRRAGFDIQTVRVPDADRVLGVKCRRQGRGLRIVLNRKVG